MFSIFSYFLSFFNIDCLYNISKASYFDFLFLISLSEIGGRLRCRVSLRFRDNRTDDKWYKRNKNQVEELEALAGPTPLTAASLIGL